MSRIEGAHDVCHMSPPSLDSGPRKTPRWLHQTPLLALRIFFWPHSPCLHSPLRPVPRTECSCRVPHNMRMSSQERTVRYAMGRPTLSPICYVLFSTTICGSPACWARAIPFSPLAVTVMPLHCRDNRRHRCSIRSLSDRHPDNRGSG